jgi:hypothetical protein
MLCQVLHEYPPLTKRGCKETSFEENLTVLLKRRHDKVHFLLSLFYDLAPCRCVSYSKRTTLFKLGSNSRIFEFEKMNK